MNLVEAVRLGGLIELNRYFTEVSNAADDELKKTLGDLAGVVRDDARARFSGVDAGSAAGYRARVRMKPVTAYVEQSKRRTTGQHPEYGPLQMRRALMPALEANAGRIEQETGRAVDRMIDR